MKSDAGSVFVESIIAAAIVAMALGTTFEVIAGGAIATGDDVTVSLSA